MLSIIKNRKSIIVFIICLLFIAANALFIAYEQYWFSLLPIALLVLALYFIALDKIVYLIAFLTPLSLNILDFDAMIGVSLPTEPLMAGVLLFFILKLLHKNPLELNFLRHPVTIVLILSLLWMCITSITSEMPLVSFKYLLARLWFVVPFFFVAVSMFKNTFNIRLFLWLFLISLAGVVIYVTFMHSTHGFDGDVAHWIMSPFFNDHTAYGAILAMFLPITLAFVFDKQYTRSLRLISLGFAFIILIGLTLSVSRAAWISVFAALGVFALIRFKIRFRWIVICVGVALAFFFSFQNSIIQKMEKNKQDSEEADISKHVKSMSNITTDASNLERLNRWRSAFRMFGERPVVGWGPGTYQFVYAPFQYSKGQTIISTNAGDKGNAHSEYFGPLCEQGLPGIVLMLLIILYVIITALKILNSDVDKRLKHYVLAVFLGLITYYCHGILNNFLDSDKASVPFWGFTAIIVAADIFHRSTKKKNNSISNSNHEVS